MTDDEQAAVTLANHVDLTLDELSSRAEDVIHNNLDELLGLDTVDSRVDDLISIGFRAGMLHARRQMVCVLKDEEKWYGEHLAARRRVDDDG